MQLNNKNALHKFQPWDYLFTTYAKFSEKTNISYPWYAHVARISGGKKC